MAGLLLVGGCDTIFPNKDGSSPVGGTNAFQMTIRTQPDNDRTPEGAPVLHQGTFNSRAGDSTGVFEDSTDFGPIEPGEAFEISFEVGRLIIDEQPPYLSMATMLVPTNDLFFSFGPEGLLLFDDSGNPRTGDVTSDLSLYDAGTEENEEPGAGDNQAPGGQCYLDSEDGSVTTVEGTDAQGISYPDVSDLVEATLSFEEEDEEGDDHNVFTLRIENVSSSATIQPAGGASWRVAPGSWMVHTDRIQPIFREGGPASTPLECLAEEGEPGRLQDSTWASTGRQLSLSPGVYAVYADTAQIFTIGQEATDAIETLAETGNPEPLAEKLSGMEIIERAGTFGDEPIQPGAPARFRIEANPRHRIQIMTAYRQANDVMFAMQPPGPRLYTEIQVPITREISGEGTLYDVGTEGSREPFEGSDQVLRQMSDDAGEEENAGIRDENNSLNSDFGYDKGRIEIEVEYEGGAEDEE
jgi:hypothetical protein